MVFKKATKEQAKLRMGIIGPAGSGKTYTALITARNLVPDGKIAVIDTERGSASKYADIFEFDVCELESFHPENYIKTIQAAEEAGYDVLSSTPFPMRGRERRCAGTSGQGGGKSEETRLLHGGT